MESGRKREGDVLIEVKILRGGHPVPVRCLVVDIEAERLVGVALLKEFYRAGCDPVGGVSFFRDVFPF